MILQSRTEKFYSIEMTEQQAQELLIVLEGLQKSEIIEVIKRMKGEDYKRRSNVQETVRAFRLVLAEYQKL